MANDSIQYERALGVWHELQQRQEFSVPVEVGTTAILFTQAVHDSRSFSGEDVVLVLEQEQQLYRDEAYIIANTLAAEGQKVEIVDSPTKTDFIDIIEDPQVVNVITIGSGSLQSLILDIDDDNMLHSVTWRDIAKSMDHLKLGYFEQRQCGHIMPKCAAIPLGVLAMSSFSKVYAAAGKFFTPAFAYGDNESIVQITPKPFLTYKEIQDLCRSLNGSDSSLDAAEDELDIC